MEHMGNSGQKRSFFASRANIVLIGFLVLGGFYLIAEHRAHLWLALPWLPWLLLLACPLMHIFMHGGHGGNDNTGSSAPDDRQAPPHQH
jgi:hypothetical protein